MRVYFDNAATTPLDPTVIAAMTAAMQNLYGNPSSIHADGRQARAAIEEARKKVAQQIGAGIGEVFFTSGGTEANNMILKNAVRDLGVQRIITSPIEHHAVLHSLLALQKTTNIEVVFLEIDKYGRISLDNLSEILRGRHRGKTLLSLMHANNEIGTMIDLAAVAQTCAEYGALFHSDTVQTLGYYPIDVSKTKIHFLNGSAHKFHGPKGVGFVYINSDVSLKPFVDGGSQERNMRGGTENTAGIIGLATALELAYTHLEMRRTAISNLHNYLKVKLLETFADIQFIGIAGESSADYTVRNDSFSQRTPFGEEGGHFKILNVSFPQSLKSDLMLFNLDIAGISASGGSACSSGAEGGSHVLDALNIDPSRKCIRFSFSHLNTIAEADFILEKLKAWVALKV